MLKHRYPLLQDDMSITVSFFFFFKGVNGLWCMLYGKYVC